ncbi:MAG: flagellar motor switch protein FliN [Oscillospiraceae bacterium]|nr:flagellar motor switch protein FliN [Oscillospiraceae bacterium]
MGLNEFNGDSVTEILKVGVGAATDTLATILGSSIDLTCGEALEKQIKDVDFASLKPAMYVVVEYSGAISGRSIMVYRQIDLSVILSILMNNEDASGDFDELSMGMLKEIINQMCNEFALKLSEFFGAQINIRISDICMFENSDTIARELDCSVVDYVISDSFQFSFGSMLKGKFVYVFDEEFADCISDLSSGNRQGIKEPVNEAAPQQMAAPQGYPQQAAPQMAAAPQQAAYQQPQMKPSRFSNPPVNVRASKFPDFNDNPINNGMMAPLTNGNMDLLMDVPLNVSVEIGKTKRKMKDILAFTQGTVIPIDKQAGAPVDIIVNGQLIARGDVVVIDDNFGVRITELVNREVGEKEN